MKKMAEQYKGQDVAFMNIFSGSSNKKIAMDPLKGGDVAAMFDNKGVWQIHGAKKYGGQVYGKNGKLMWSYTHKKGAIAYANGGALYTSKWGDAIVQCIGAGLDDKECDPK